MGTPGREAGGLDRLQRTPITRAVFHGTLDTAAGGGDAEGRRIVRGVGNSFKVMYSGRLIHPAAVERWLAERDAQARLPLMLQHGGSGDQLATIGRVLTLAMDRSRGLTFTAELAQDIPAADAAWKLIQQGMAPQISIGWWGKARWVRADEPNLDEWVAGQLKAAGVEEAYVFFTFELAEISLVDIGDDPGARLAASAQQGELKALRAEVAGLRRELAELAALKAGGLPEGALNALQATFDGFLEQWQDAVIAMLASDKTVGEAAHDLLEMQAGRIGPSERGDGTLDSARAALDRFGAVRT